MFRFIRIWRVKRQIKRYALNLLVEVFGIVMETIDSAERDGLIKDKKTKEILKFELSILAFWFIQAHFPFTEQIKAPILKAFYQEYAMSYRRKGHNTNTINKVLDEIQKQINRYYDVLDNKKYMEMEFMNRLKNKGIAIDMRLSLLPHAILEKIKIKTQTMEKDYIALGGTEYVEK